MVSQINFKVLNLTKVFFLLNSTYYLVQLTTFFFISSIATPSDIGISSYVISLAGIFAVTARYGMPVYLIESINENSSTLIEYYKNATAFSFTLSILMIPISFLLISFNNLDSEFILLMLLGTILMIIFNPISMIIEQFIILNKQTEYLSLNSLLKTFLFPLTAYFSYKISGNFAATLIFANLSILLSPIIVYSIFEKRLIKIAFNFTNLNNFLLLIKQAFPYFINSLALILILSIDKIFVGNLFSVDVLGSYDLMWKLAILIDFLVMQPLNALFSRDILNLSNRFGHQLSLTITFLTIFIVLLINNINFDLILPLWNIFFDNYEFNKNIFQLAISFFILMFAVNQLRNLMANLKLRLMCTISSCIIPMPLILTASTIDISLLSFIPTLIIIGVCLSLAFNLTVYNYFYFYKKHDQKNQA